MTDEHGPVHKGRPRSPETIARDRRILEILVIHGPMTRNDLARHLGISHSLTSIAINRLKKAELIRRCVGEDGANVWTAEVDAPCP